MQLHTLQSGYSYPEKKRVARGGKRGTTSGRGTKGQRSRSGHRIRPAQRDFIIRLPKLRGYKNKPLQEKLMTLNIGDLEKRVSGTEVNASLVGNVKILGGGEVKKAFTIEGLAISASAKAKIEKAGGKVIAPVIAIKKESKPVRPEISALKKAAAKKAKAKA